MFVIYVRFLFFQCQQQFPQDLAGRGGGNAALIQHRGQLVNVRTDDVCLGHGTDSLQKLQKADTACLGRACAREDRRVKTVQVDGQITRHIGLAQPIGQLGQPGKVKLMHIGMPRGELKFFPIAAADTELVDAPVTDQIVAAAQHAGMAELCAKIIVPQVGVGIKMYDVQIRILAHGRANRP